MLIDTIYVAFTHTERVDSVTRRYQFVLVLLIEINGRNAQVIDVGFRNAVELDSAKLGTYRISSKM